jgi:hypothetical protein
MMLLPRLQMLPCAQSQSMCVELVRMAHTISNASGTIHLKQCVIKVTEVGSHKPSWSH